MSRVGGLVGAKNVYLYTLVYTNKEKKADNHHKLGKIKLYLIICID